MEKFVEELVSPLLFPTSRATITFVPDDLELLVTANKCYRTKIERSDSSFRITFTRVPGSEFELKI